jgi:hypothetical protein
MGTGEASCAGLAKDFRRERAVRARSSVLPINPARSRSIPYGAHRRRRPRVLVRSDPQLFWHR